MSNASNQLTESNEEVWCASFPLRSFVAGAPIAQLDRALVYGTRCRKFESSWVRRIGILGRPRLPSLGFERLRVSILDPNNLHADDEQWMRDALELADHAMTLDEVPVGAILVENGAALATGYNLRETESDPTAHAEIIALRAGAKKKGSWRLEGCTLYVTLEPCAMCAGALVNARIGRVVWGCDDPKAGACATLFTIGQDARLNHRFAMTHGVLEVECAERLKRFFGKLRAQGKK